MAGWKSAVCRWVVKVCGVWQVELGWQAAVFGNCQVTEPRQKKGKRPRRRQRIWRCRRSLSILLRLGLDLRPGGRTERKKERGVENEKKKKMGWDGGRRADWSQRVAVWPTEPALNTTHTAQRFTTAVRARSGPSNLLLAHTSRPGWFVWRNEELTDLQVGQ